MAFLKGVCRSLILVLIFAFLMRQGSETLLSETRAGGHTQREWWRRKISLRYFDRRIARRQHSPPVVDRRWNQLGYSTDGVGSRLSTQPPHGYYPAQVPSFAEVIDLHLTVRLQSVFVCIPRLLGVVVSLEIYAAPPLLYTVPGMSYKKSQCCCTGI